MHLLMCSVNLSGSFFFVFPSVTFFFFPFFSFFLLFPFFFFSFFFFFTVFLFSEKKYFIAYLWFPFPFFLLPVLLFSFCFMCPFFFFSLIYFSLFWYFFFKKKSWWLFPSASPLLGWRRSAGTPSWVLHLCPFHLVPPAAENRSNNPRPSAAPAELLSF